LRSVLGKGSETVSKPKYEQNGWGCGSSGSKYEALGSIPNTLKKNQSKQTNKNQNSWASKHKKQDKYSHTAWEGPLMTHCTHDPKDCRG
jgi:Zn-dependent M32 family carboxypeptidase